MGLKVIFTPQSMDDLKAIVAFIARDNPERARTFGNELIDRARYPSPPFPNAGARYRKSASLQFEKSCTAHIESSTRFARKKEQFLFCVSGTAREARRKSSPSHDF
jgi:plasmid stabilization system protein ParE